MRSLAWDPAAGDVDNNAATGGDVTIVQGAEVPHAEHGIDYRVQIFGDPCFSIHSTDVLKWDGADFTEVVAEMDPEHLVFVDESGATTVMTRYSRSILTRPVALWPPPTGSSVTPPRRGN